MSITVIDSGYCADRFPSNGATDAVMSLHRATAINYRNAFLQISGVGASLNGSTVVLPLRVQANGLQQSNDIEVWVTQSTYNVDTQGTSAQTELYLGLLTGLPSDATITDYDVDLTTWINDNIIPDTSNLDGGNGYNAAKDITFVFIPSTTVGVAFNDSFTLYDESGDDDATAKNYPLTIDGPSRPSLSHPFSRPVGAGLTARYRTISAKTGSQASSPRPELSNPFGRPAGAGLVARYREFNAKTPSVPSSPRPPITEAFGMAAGAGLVARRRTITAKTANHGLLLLRRRAVV